MYRCLMFVVLLLIVDIYCKEVLLDTFPEYWTTSHHCSEKWKRIDYKWSACSSYSYKSCILRTNYIQTISPIHSLYIYIKTSKGSCSSNNQQQQTTGTLNVTVHFKRNSDTPRLAIKPIKYQFLCPSSLTKPLEIIGPWQPGIYMEYDVEGSCLLEDFKVYYHTCEPPYAQFANYNKTFAPSSSEILKTVYGRCVENSYTSTAPKLLCYKNGTSIAIGRCHCGDKYFQYDNQCSGVDAVRKINYSNYSDGSVIIHWRPPLQNPDGYFTYLVSINNETKRVGERSLYFQSSLYEAKDIKIKVIAEFHIENKTYTSKPTSRHITVYQLQYNAGFTLHISWWMIAVIFWTCILNPYYRLR